MFTGSETDCVLCVFMSWAEDEIWIRFLRENSNIPMIYYRPTVEEITFHDCGIEDDFVECLSSHGLVGSLVGSGSIQKMGRTAEVVVGGLDAVGDRIIPLAEACRVRSVLEKSRFSLMGLVQ